MEAVVYRCEVPFPFKYTVDLADSPVLGSGSEALEERKGERMVRRGLQSREGSKTLLGESSGVTLSSKTCLTRTAAEL